MLQQYWAGQGTYEYVSVDQFSEAFRNSPIGQRNAAALAQPYDKAQHKKEALVLDKWSLTGMLTCSPCLTPNLSMLVSRHQPHAASLSLCPSAAFMPTTTCNHCQEVHSNRTWAGGGNGNCCDEFASCEALCATILQPLVTGLKRAIQGCLQPCHH